MSPWDDQNPLQQGRGEQARQGEVKVELSRLLPSQVWPGSQTFRKPTDFF